MNIDCNVSAGAIFSMTMLCFQTLLSYDINNIENISFTNVNKRIMLPNPFDLIYKQNKECVYTTINNNFYPAYQDLYHSTDLSRLKQIRNKLVFNDSFLNIFNTYLQRFNINENTLGVHVRLTEMNTHHLNDYGYRSFDDFVKKIDEIIDNYENIFVASDNNESLQKLQKIYSNKIMFCDNMVRFEKEIDSSSLVWDNLSTENFWMEGYTEMLLLSKCSGLIHRVSNLPNTSIIFSDTLKNVYSI